MTERPPQAVLFDFGGVIAEEGFREGLKEIAHRNGLEPEAFYRSGSEAVYDSGYVTGEADEEAFWQMLCSRTGLEEYEESYTEAILERFRLRPEMLKQVDALSARGFLVAILSDQTDWLDRLEARHRFFHRFERIFNSYHLGLSKRDPQIFDYVVNSLGTDRSRTLFVDDNEGHIARAKDRGLLTLHFTEMGPSIRELRLLSGRGEEV